MSEMEDRVAKAIAAAESEWRTAQVRTGKQWDEPPPEIGARAAIASMRKPTDRMLNAGQDALGHRDEAYRTAAYAVFTAMIDAALAEKETK